MIHNKTKTLLLLALTMVAQGLALAQPVSRETALRAATTFLDNNSAPTAQLTDVSASAGFAHLYVFTTDKSFVLLAADSRVQPVLGYSLDGPFKTEGMPENVRWWLQGYEEGIRYAIDNNVKAAPEVTRQWQDLKNGTKGSSAKAAVDPLIQTHWGQGSPFNNQCPSGCITGCVATAMAQILNYHRPATGVGSHSYPWNSQTLTANFGATTYDWDNMLNSYGSNSGTEQQKQAVATLMFHCGVSLEMQYSSSASGSTDKRASVAYPTFYNCDAVFHKRQEYQDSVWMAMLKNELDQLRPVQYGGNGSQGGHSFICDGYDTDGRFHFNFGWNGSDDGFFTIQENGFPNDQDAVFHIAPLPCDASAPSELTYTLDGYHATLSWVGGQNAVSYNIYRNNTLIANSSDCEYVDEAGLGDNTYYIRSIDASGQLSSPSNSISVRIDEYQPPIVDDLSGEGVNREAVLSWSTPWWYPQSVSSSLSYVEKTRPQPDRFLRWDANTLHLFWGIRFSPEELNNHEGESLFSTSFYIYHPGCYEVLVYQGTSDGHPNELMTQQRVTTTDNGWIDVKMDEPTLLDTSLDLWVFILDVGGTVRELPVVATTTPHGQYYGGSFGEALPYPHESCYELDVQSFQCDWLIMANLTDGTYTYNLYRDGNVIANQISDTHYTDSNLADGTYTYHVTTNYYGGETTASNTVTVTLPTPTGHTDTLTAGWNWWTPSVEVTLNQLTAALGTHGLTIESQGDGSLTYENGSWSGDLQSLVAGKMYKIQVGNTYCITLSGTALDNVSVNPGDGITWFGYTGPTTQTISAALGDFIPSAGDKIVDQDEGFAIYNGTRWEGTLTDLKHGKGYIYITATANTLTF